MTDPLDRASDVESQQREDAIEAQRVRSAQGIDPSGESAHDCAVCLEPISRARRAALPGVQTCIDCQTELEHAQKQAIGGYP
jgi:phage/conjugal plasmid C-4 type zinc finger TraR family protein